MPQTAPTKAPAKTATPETSPDPDRGWEMDPDKMCPAQREHITRTVTPFLP